MSDESSITTEGARRFRCLGGDCEYTCCAGWRIPVDRVHYDLLKARMEETAAGRRAFANAVRKEGDETSMRLLANGNCACLTADKVCQIQVSFGETSLPNACAQYPRSLGVVAGRREMWGSLSCPEMVRQCLFAEDGMALVEIDAEPFSRELERRVPANPEAPYDRELERVRTAVLALLSRRDLPIAFRLYLLADLGVRTNVFFHRGAARFERARLTAELARLESAKDLATARAAFDRIEVPERIASNVAAGIRALQGDRELAPLIASVFDGGGGWQSYRERRATWELDFGPSLELAFEAHARSYWLKEWYVTSPDLLAHLQPLLCRALMARFLLFGHPELAAAAASPEREVRRRALDRALVEVVSRVTRAVEHNRELMGGIEAAFAAGVEQGFAHAAVLAIA